VVVSAARSMLNSAYFTQKVYQFTSDRQEKRFLNQQPNTLTRMKLKHYSMILVLCAASMLAAAQTPAYLNSREAQAYNASGAEVKKFAKIAIGDQMAALTIKHSLSAEEQTAVRVLVEERETRMATYNALYPSDDIARYNAKAAVKQQYRDKLVRTLFAYIKIVGSYNCRMIMRNKDTLRLTTAQQAQIADWAVKVDSMLEADPKLELKPIEFPILCSIFTPKQVDVFLNLKLHEEVLGQVAKTWKTLTENSLEYGMDSTVAAKELYNYHMARDKAIYVNYADQAAKDAALKSINDAAPQAIRRANSVADAVKAKNAYNGTLTW
jgi:hypothetical protein